MARLWETLPPEILELVLACLPVQVLCRFRLVCKRWNHLITQAGFASLYAQAPRQASSVLITRRFVDFAAHIRRHGDWESTNWEILDMLEKRFYSLGDSFIHNHLWSDFSECCSNYTWAADGGLIYATYNKAGPRTRHVVCNPVSKSFHHIPAPEYQFSYHGDIVVMSVDKVTQSYRIIVMESYGTRTSRQEEVQPKEAGMRKHSDSRALEWLTLHSSAVIRVWKCPSMHLKCPQR